MPKQWRNQVTSPNYYSIFTIVPSICKILMRFSCAKYILLEADALKRYNNENEQMGVIPWR
jgi:hypothetical protein